MEDLNGLDWSSTSSKTNQNMANNYLAMRPDSASQYASKTMPIFIQRHGSGMPSPKPAVISKPMDSFSNLVSLGSMKEDTLTLQQRMQKLEAKKREEEAEKKTKLESQFGNGRFWDEIESKSLRQNNMRSPVISHNEILTQNHFKDIEVRPVSPETANGKSIVGVGSDEDLFAAFNSETKVDRSSHYPPPAEISKRENTSTSSTSKYLDLSRPQAWESQRTSANTLSNQDDDPFSLREVKTELSFSTKRYKKEEDLLGELGKPVEEVRVHNTLTPKSMLEHNTKYKNKDLWDKAVAELIDMGFSVEQARHGLIESGSDLNIQVAVSWILNDAHRQSNKNKINKEKDNRENRDKSTTKSNLGDAFLSRREDYSLTQELRYNPRTSSGDLDISKSASIVGNNIAKTANSLWKISQKKVQKVVSDFKQDSGSEPKQPKWMQEAAHYGCIEDVLVTNRPKMELKSRSITDEALLLEVRDHHHQAKTKAFDNKNLNQKSSQDQSSILSKTTSKISGYESGRHQSDYKDNRDWGQLTGPKSNQTNSSPGRVRKASPQFTRTTSESKTSIAKPSNSSHALCSASESSHPLPPRAKIKPRQLPYLSPAQLNLSTQHRLAGTSYFKRGDYALAYSSYSSSLTPLPASHPVNIVLLCNRALTSLKNGVPKSAVSDADRALELIGLSRGEGETIDLGPGEGGGIKEMKSYYGKALLRKAEALEQMERWKDAGEVWKICVEQGVGGSTAIVGRTRCEKLVNSKSSPPQSVRSTPLKNNRPKPSKYYDPIVSSGNSAAVRRLRESNEKAEIAENQRLLLTDKVDAKVALWRDGKRDNLRALIGSLDAIMWEGSGWKGVGMHELIQNNKVKIHYMKAIGKTHPDKLPQDATIEVRMIAALVFATLNESWDKFKQQNGM
ncbi:UBA domain-containing protein 7 [Golovinomyces cichoracearum]|uniref:UBA domain-containing protein 7 n=1 Tax=Golovinomyces cichoracearum TaxID=62708 RepID=A0A420IIS7_9PEZI|nr:UBA domain-containing protein 7 [Golovinomyces cichoracearum]